MKALLILSLIFTLNNASTQDVDWLVKPVLTECDDISIQEGTRHIILFKKDGLWGIKTTEDKTILPPAYKKIDIWDKGNYFYAIRDGQDQFFDAEGNEVVNTKALSAERNHQIEVKKAETNALVKSIEGNISDIFIHHERRKKRSFFNVINIFGDTIIKNHVGIKNIEAVLEKFIRYYDRELNKNFILDINGEVVTEINGRKINFEVDESAGVFGVRYNENEAEIWDESGQSVFQVQDFNFIPLQPYYTVTTEGKEYLIDDNHTKVFNEGASYIRQLNDSPWIVAWTDTGSSIYNVITRNRYKTSVTLYDQMNESQMKIQMDSLMGVYDLKRQKTIIPPQYGSIIYYGDHFITSMQSQNKKNKADDVERKILRTDGSELYSKSCRGIYPLDGLFLIHDTDNSYMLLDSNAKVIKTYPQNTRIRARGKTGKWLRIVSYGGGGYFTTDLKTGNERSFQEIGDYIEMNENYSELHIARFKGYWGAINDAGDTVIPFHFDSLKPYKQQGQADIIYLIAGRRGKKGIMKRPFSR